MITSPFSRIKNDMLGESQAKQIQKQAEFEHESINVGDEDYDNYVALSNDEAYDEHKDNEIKGMII